MVFCWVSDKRNAWGFVCRICGVGKQMYNNSRSVTMHSLWDLLMFSVYWFYFVSFFSLSLRLLRNREDESAILPAHVALWERMILRMATFTFTQREMIYNHYKLEEKMSISGTQFEKWEKVHYRRWCDLMRDTQGKWDSVLTRLTEKCSCRGWWGKERSQARDQGWDGEWSVSRVQQHQQQ